MLLRYTLLLIIVINLFIIAQPQQQQSRRNQKSRRSSNLTTEQRRNPISIARRLSSSYRQRAPTTRAKKQIRRAPQRPKRPQRGKAAGPAAPPKTVIRRETRNKDEMPSLRPPRGLAAKLNRAKLKDFMRLGFELMKRRRLQAHLRRT